MFFPTANTHILYPVCMETLSFRSLSISLSLSQKRLLTTRFRVSLHIPTRAHVNKPRFPPQNQATTMPRSKTSHDRTNKNGGNSTSSDVLFLMDSIGFTVTPDIYACLIDECTRKEDDYRALELWAHLKRNKSMMRFLFKPNGFVLLNRILIMFMRCGCIDGALQLFDKMSRRDTAVWCLMIAGLVDNSLHFEALDLFSHMMYEPLNHENDAILQILLACVLKACVHDMNMELGRTLHGWAIKLGYTRDLHVSTAFLDFYKKFKCPRETNLVFYDQVQHNSRFGDTVFWTGAIVSNSIENRLEETMAIFMDMRRAGIRKNEFTFSSVLKACGRLQDDGSCGQQAHADAIKHGLVESHVFVQCSLVNMYAKSGKLKDARRVFDSISYETRNESNPCWNAMINGYLDNGAYVEAIKTLYQMKAAGVKPQDSLLNRVKVACGTKING